LERLNLDLISELAETKCCHLTALLLMDLGHV
jgi:hypothetical protein